MILEEDEAMLGERVNVPVGAELLEAIGANSAWSDAVCVGPFIWVTGQLGWDKSTGEFAEGIEAQTELALDNVRDVLGRAGATLADIVSVRVYLAHHDDYHRYERVYQRYFPENHPVRVSIVVEENIHHALIDFEVMAVKADS